MKEKNGTASGKSAGTAPHLTTKKKNARSAGNERFRHAGGDGNRDPGQAAGDRGQAEPMGIRPPGESGLRARRRAPIGERTAASGTSPSDMSVPGKHRPVTARSCAMEVLLRCERSGQYSNIALDAALERSGLSAEDRALTARLVYGVTERRITLDRILSSLSDREDMEPEVRTALRLGLYQLAYLDRIPDHAAVDESVRLVSRRASGFVNAVLRQFLRTGKIIPLPPEPDAADLAGQAGPGTDPAAIPAVSVSATAPAASARNPEQVHFPPLSDTARKTATEYLSVLCSVPAPLVSKFLDFYPYDRVKSLLLAFGETAPLTLRVNTEKITRDDLIALLEKAGVSAQPARYAPTGVTLPAGAGMSLRDLPGFADGLFFVQDEASQICTAAVGARPGDTVADVCACPGSKSFGMALDMKNTGRVFSSDLHESKLSLIRDGAKRLSIKIISASAHDARTPDPSLLGKCDRVLCDVPCSGYGVIGKKPELRYKDPAETAALPDIQLGIALASADLVKPGGVLVYSTCTLFPEENEGNVARFLAVRPDFAPEGFSVGAQTAETDPGTDHGAKTGTASEGYFVGAQPVKPGSSEPNPSGAKIPGNISGIGPKTELPAARLDVPSGMVTLAPDTHGTDGFFVAKLRRKRE